MENCKNSAFECNFIQNLCKKITEIYNDVIEHENFVLKCEVCSKNINEITFFKNQLLLIVRNNIEIKEENSKCDSTITIINDKQHRQCRNIKDEVNSIIKCKNEFSTSRVDNTDTSESCDDRPPHIHLEEHQCKSSCMKNNTSVSTIKSSFSKNVSAACTNHEFYECALCYLKVSKKCHLVLHMKSHIKTKKQGLWKRKHKERNLQSNENTESTKKCPFCRRMYKRKHECNSVEGKSMSRFCCIYCPETFSTYPKIYYHHKAEHPENAKPLSPFQCEVCGKFTIQLSALRHHMKTHTGYTPHECDVCQKKFRTRHQLTEHLRKHIPKAEKDDKYKCDVCQKKFTFRQSLKKHERLQHTDNREFFICTICGWKFISEKSLQKHITSHNTEKVPAYKCDCGRIFEKLKYLNQHRKIQHNILTDLMLNRKTTKRE